MSGGMLKAFRLSLRNPRGSQLRRNQTISPRIKPTSQPHAPTPWIASWPTSKCLTTRTTTRMIQTRPRKRGPRAMTRHRQTGRSPPRRTASRRRPSRFIFEPSGKATARPWTGLRGSIPTTATRRRFPSPSLPGIATGYVADSSRPLPGRRPLLRGSRGPVRISLHRCGLACWRAQSPGVEVAVSASSCDRAPVLFWQGFSQPCPLCHFVLFNKCRANAIQNMNKHVKTVHEKVHCPSCAQQFSRVRPDSRAPLGWLAAPGTV
jgi:hypothetical protein